MTVEELIAALLDLPLDADVFIYDRDGIPWCVKRVSTDRDGDIVIEYV